MQKTNPEDMMKWLLNQDIEGLDDSKNGNIKMQKLLFFAQMIYMYKHNGTTIFEDEFYAFEHGVVLEKSRNTYKKRYIELLKDAKEQKYYISEDINEILELTKNIFGKCSADELSDMSHDFESWKKYYNKSLEGFWHNKEKSKIPYEELKNELYKIEKVLKAYEITSNEIDDGEDY